MSLTAQEQETIILFNAHDAMASIFTYSKTWQQHLEKKLGLKPVMVNSKGGREYEIDKKRIPKPRAPRKITAETRAKSIKSLAAARAKRQPSGATEQAVRSKSADGTKKPRNTTPGSKRGEAK